MRVEAALILLIRAPSFSVMTFSATFLVFLLLSSHLDDDLHVNEPKLETETLKHPDQSHR